MAVTTITPTKATGTVFNITTGTYTTMSTGSGNGVEWAAELCQCIILKNTTGGNATYTFLANQPTSVSKFVTIANDTVVVATAEEVAIMVDSDFYSTFKDASGNFGVECDVAGQIVVIKPQD